MCVVYIVHYVLCAVADIADCGATYQTTYTNNSIYRCYIKNYLTQVPTECPKNVIKDLLWQVKHYQNTKYCRIVGGRRDPMQPGILETI